MDEAELKQIASEMKKYAWNHPYDPKKTFPITADYCRDITYKGQDIGLVFSYNNMDGISFWQLTISEMPIPKDILDEVCRCFFPSGQIHEFDLGLTHQYAQLDETNWKNYDYACRN